MIIALEDFLTPEQLGGSTQENPVTAVIKNVGFREKDDIPFESAKGRYELLVDLHGDEIKWFPNKTSLRAFRSAFGDDTENWIGKEVQLWTLEQLVQRKLRRVIYAEAA